MIDTKSDPLFPTLSVCTRLTSSYHDSTVAYTYRIDRYNAKRLVADPAGKPGLAGTYAYVRITTPNFPHSIGIYATNLFVS